MLKERPPGPEDARAAVDGHGVPSTTVPRLTPRRFSRGRLWAFRALESALSALGGRRWYRWRFLGPGRLRVRHEPVEVQDLPPGLEGVRIVHWSDLHAGPFLAAGDLDYAVQVSNAVDPHLVVLTGDLITRRTEEAFLVVEQLRGLRARWGKFAVFGNHDYRGRREGEIERHYAERAGFVFLRDRCVRFPVAGGALALVGLEDLEEGRNTDPEEARAQVQAGDVEVVLCHNPKGAPHLARPGCALVLSGHTHGHQIDLPWVRRLAPAHPGDRRPLGAAVGLVSRGLGVLGVPMRVRAPAEVVVVELRRPRARGAVA